MRKILLLGSLVFFGFLSPINTLFAETASEKIPVEVFERLDCKHCRDEKVFLHDLSTRRNDFYVNFHDISIQEENDLWTTIAKLESLPKVTPITLVGNTIIQGFDSSETTGKRIEELIEKSRGKDVLTLEEFIESGGSGNVESVEGGTCDSDSIDCEIKSQPMIFTVPFIGIVDLSGYSLPLLSGFLGLIDGFNPCAMWVLVTFLVVLSQAGSQRRMWQIAGLFIIAETVMYYLILNVWFTTWNFVGLDNIVTPIVGFVAIGGGLFFLYEWKTSDGTCKVTNLQQRSKTSNKIKELVNSPFTLLSIVGVIGLAFSVNVIEFACSIGIPQAFTKILDINNLSAFMQQVYMLIYIFFYMVDDFIVFGIALYSFEKIGLTTKYSKISNLVGGVLMIILGLILILKPSLLVF